MVQITERLETNQFVFLDGIQQFQARGTNKYDEGSQSNSCSRSQHGELAKLLTSVRCRDHLQCYMVFVLLCLIFGSTAPHLTEKKKAFSPVGPQKARNKLDRYLF